MKNPIHLYRRRRLRKFATSFTAALKERFGRKPLYTADEIEEVGTYIGMNAKEREWAYGMFAKEEACQGFLTRIGSSQTASGLRFILAGQMFGYGTSVGYDGLWNRFDDPEDLVIGGISSVGSDGASGAGFFGGFDHDGGDGGGSDCGGSDSGSSG